MANAFKVLSSSQHRPDVSGVRHRANKNMAQWNLQCNCQSGEPACAAPLQIGTPARGVYSQYWPHFASSLKGDLGTGEKWQMRPGHMQRPPGREARLHLHLTLLHEVLREGNHRACWMDRGIAVRHGPRQGIPLLGDKALVPQCRE
jgi:hypothetical protein